MSTWDLLAGLEVRIDGYAIDPHSREVRPGWSRITNTYVLHGGGLEGRGEDITKWPPVAQAVVDRGPHLPLAGTFTLAEFSEHLQALDLFPDVAPEFPDEDPVNRRWGFESAAADLALRQAGTSLHELLGRTPRPVRFVASFGLGAPPSAEPVTRRLAAYPGLRLKLDAVPEWLATPGLLDEIAATRCVDAVDFKGLYRNQLANVPTDPDLYRRVAETFPDAWLEDPDLKVPEADAALEPHRDRITWDAPIHGVEDIEALPHRHRDHGARAGESEAAMDVVEVKRGAIEGPLGRRRDARPREA